MNAMHFDGVSGSVIVSFIAFSIVFAVLFGLTVMIYAMRLFAGGKSNKPKDTPSKPTGGTPAPAAPVAAVAAPTPAPAAPVQATGSATGKIVAAITAAIIEATNGMGRVMSITPELAVEGAGQRHCSHAAKRWKTAGVVRLVDSVVDRGWRR